MFRLLCFIFTFSFAPHSPSLREVWLVEVVVGGALDDSSIHFSFVGRNVFLSKVP